MEFRFRASAAVALCSWLTSSPAVGQRAESVPRLAWNPAIPRQGSLVVIGFESRATDSVRAVRGELGGEPLHFELIDGWFRAIGAVPLGSGKTLRARLVIERAGGAMDTVTRRMPVAVRRTGSERLRTDPRFLQPPESVLARIEVERALLRSLKQRAHGVPRLWHAPFVRPRPGPVTSGYGTARVFNGRVRSRHLGVDFDGDVGDPVLATNRGVVAYAGDLYYSGTTVFVDHGAGLLTAYLHLSTVLVAVGDSVTPGQIIGRVGASGRVTGPHLHWLATYGNIAVDPVNLLDLDLSRPLVAR
ncbi:MAG TPA: M23 family metallopeptidase [Gemmatimonadales bacterium]|nr:M23 family metallopeptidase [Gemmatimonadales bacterium]